MLTIITLPSGFTTDITANMSSIFTDLAPYTTLVIGISLALVAIGVLIHYIKK